MQSSEEQRLFEIEICCDIINVFIITFDQFKASLLNKSINFYHLFPKIQAFEWYSEQCYKSFLIQINADLWIFLFIEVSWK